ERAEDWPWSSLRWVAAPHQAPVRLEPGTVPRGALWVEGVNAATADVELERVRESVRRDRPLGTSSWTRETAQALGLEHSLRPRGRPPRVVAGAAASRVSAPSEVSPDPPGCAEI